MGIQVMNTFGLEVKALTFKYDNDGEKYYMGNLYMDNKLVTTISDSKDYGSVTLDQHIMTKETYQEVINRLSKMVKTMPNSYQYPDLALLELLHMKKVEATLKQRKNCIAISFDYFEIYIKDRILPLKFETIKKDNAKQFDKSKLIAQYYINSKNKVEKIYYV